jgi:NADH-quinone oxidoreductase subunit H
MTIVAAIIASPWLVPAATGLVLSAVFPIGVGYLSLLERKLLADFQGRLGPMRVGPHGLLQPLADALKMLLKEDTVPALAERSLFLSAPILSVVAAMLGLTILPFASRIFVSDVNIGLLAFLAFSALAVLGIILGGWASNSHYSLLGALRSAAQLVSYEVGLALGLVAVVMMSGTLDLRTIVQLQLSRHAWFAFSNFGAMLLPFAVFFLAGVAETNRVPFDLPEAESELVAGYHTEFSGFRWGLYMLAEWGNILVVSSVAVTVFWGGWLRPFPSVAALELPLSLGFPLLLFVGIGGYCAYRARKMHQRHEAVILILLSGAFLAAGLVFLLPASREQLSGLFWFLFKLAFFVYAVIWLRGTLPRVRYDQLMSLGWKYLVPLGLAGIALNAVIGLLW